MTSPVYVSPPPDSGTPRSANSSRYAGEPVASLRYSSEYRRNGGGSSNRSSPGSGGSVAGSVSSLQSANGNVPPVVRLMDQFEMTFVTEPDPRFLCPVCEKVMRYPVQFEECGHRCCSACLPNLVRLVYIVIEAF